MKKALLITTSIIITLTVCILGVLIHNTGLQTVFFSLRTALHKDATYSIQNYSTDNFYILQTSATNITLYRRQQSGNMLRYQVSGTNITTATADKNGWSDINSGMLPADITQAIKEIECLCRGKSTETIAIKAYLDALTDLIASTNIDSTVILDYNSFPVVAKELIHFLQADETKQKTAYTIRRKGLRLQYEVYPFNDDSICLRWSEIISQVFHDEYTSVIRDALHKTLQTLQDFKIEIEQHAFGQFISLKIYENSMCIFKIDKIKQGTV